MSRDGYERWADEPESGRRDSRGGRRSRRSAAAEDSWPAGSRPEQGSWQRVDPAAYTDPGGYADPGQYPDSGRYGNSGGYQDSGGYPRPPAGYSGAGSYGDSRDYDPGTGQYYDSGGASRRALPAGNGGYDSYGANGYGDNGYAENGYPQGRYSGSGGHSQYPASGYQGGADPRYGDGAYSGSGYGENGHSDQGYSQPGYRDAGYPGDEYSGGGRDPYGGAGTYGGPDQYRTDPGGGPAGYGSRDPYGADEQYGGHDQYGESAGYGASGGYPALEGYNQPGAGRGAAGYDAPAGYERDGGYDDDEYALPAGAGGLGGPGGRGAEDSDSFGWQGPVDDAGLVRRRGRGSEDEIDADSARHNGFFRGFGGGDDDYGHRPPKQRRSRAPIVALTVVVVFLVAVVGGGVYAYKWYSKRHADWTGSVGFGSVDVTVKPGEFACSPSLENTLVSTGVVASAEAFCDAAKSAANPNALEPGTFKLRKHMGAALAWKLLINPKSRVQKTVVIPDGLPDSKIITLLSKGTGIPVSKFDAALKDTSALGLPSFAQGNPEGFLYPATYDFQGQTAPDILKAMVAQFNTQVASLNLAAAAKKAQLSKLQIVTEASLLEGEVGPKYFADVARVIDNRLNQGMPLELDSTIAFATGDYSFNLSNKQLHVNSPYNTFTHPGLPPGPIDSPDIQAIEAVLHPDDSATARTWLYFITVNKAGKTLFTASASQFDAWQALAKQNGV
jgi:uncharacterized YceG family protein